MVENGCLNEMCRLWSNAPLNSQPRVMISSGIMFSGLVFLPCDAASPLLQGVDVARVVEVCAVAMRP